METTPPTSVVPPTTRWTSACTEVAEQLREDDELLVVCDAPGDPVATLDGELPSGVRIVHAGVPEGCSGKANAVTAGWGGRRYRWPAKFDVRVVEE